MEPHTSYVYSLSGVNRVFGPHGVEPKSATRWICAKVSGGLYVLNSAISSVLVSLLFQMRILAPYSVAITMKTAELGLGSEQFW